MTLLSAVRQGCVYNVQYCQMNRDQQVNKWSVLFLTCWLACISLLADFTADGPHRVVFQVSMNSVAFLASPAFVACHQYCDICLDGQYWPKRLWRWDLSKDLSSWLQY